MMKMEKVKIGELFGCPFCGEEPTVWKTDFGVQKVMECESCHTLFVSEYGLSTEELKEHWNRRVAPGQRSTEWKAH